MMMMVRCFKLNEVVEVQCTVVTSSSFFIVPHEAFRQAIIE